MIKHPGNILIVGDSLIGRENNEGIDPGLIQFGQKGRLLEPGFIRKRCTKVALPGAHILKVVKFLENYDAPESVSDLVLLVGGNDVENSYCPEINGWRFVPVGCILTHLQQLSKVIQERFPKRESSCSTLSPVNTRMRGIRPEKRRSLLLSAENAP